MQSPVMRTAILAPGCYPKLTFKKQVGLTLIEVLIALAIVAIALSAIIKAVSENIRGTAYLEDKTVAMYVATQIVNEARVGILQLQSQAITEKTDMLGKAWYWQAEAVATPNPQIRKINVRVYKTEPEDEDTPTIVTMESYIYAAKK